MATKRKRIPGPIYYTTHQVAGFLGVSLPTVVNWVKSGRLKAHRTPGGHRRIARNELVVFSREYDYPLSEEFLADEPGRRRVLIVDDERDFSEMVRDYLAIKGGYDVEIADSGFSAGFTVARFKPHLILMDIMMPGMDGFDVFHMLRERRDTRHIPVIACTSYRDREIEARIDQEAFNAFIQKPLKLDELLAKIRQMVGAPGRPVSV